MSESVSDDDAEEGGLRIVVSPIQLSAILQGKSISQAETLSGRFFSSALGTVEIISGAIQLISGVALIALPEPTTLTKVGGSLLAGHGVDDIYAGVAQAWTGENANTLTYEMAKRGCEALGCRPDVAGIAGVVADIAVPTSIAGYFKAVRLLTVRAGLIDLEVEETSGGHTMAKHVGKSDPYLLNRVQPKSYVKPNGKVKTKKGASGSASYKDLAEAEKFTSTTLRVNKKKIEQWVKFGTDETLELNYDNSGILPFVDYSVGRGVVRGSTTFLKTNKCIVVLERKTVNGKQFFVLTSYPNVK